MFRLCKESQLQLLVLDSALCTCSDSVRNHTVTVTSSSFSPMYMFTLYGIAQLQLLVLDSALCTCPDSVKNHTVTVTSSRFSPMYMFRLCKESHSYSY